MSSADAFWNWAIVMAIALSIAAAGIFAIGYLSVSLWRNRHRK